VDLPDGYVPCSSCAELVLFDDTFCESCGATLRTAPKANSGTAATNVCVQCNGAVGPDQYCTECGHKQPAPRDHMEIDLGATAAGVADRGIRHHRNEDSMQLAVTVDGRVIAVVCDGVSSSSRSDEASQAAVDATLDCVRTLLATGATATEALLEGAVRANEAVSAIAAEPGSEPPSCTFVAGVVAPGELTLAWIGDSRAYVLTGAALTLESSDDSWARLQVDMGAMTEADAMADRRAHVITRWLGSDSDREPARTKTVALSEGAVVLLCSDGLWNEVSDHDLATFMNADPNRSPLDVARELCAAANTAGGRDNITVLVVPPITVPATSVPQFDPQVSSS
jgi:PPM family protein phosphatase